MKKINVMNKIYIIGLGRVGSAFAYELADIGYDIKYITDRNEDQLRETEFKNNTISISSNINREFLSGSDLIIISVQDKFIKDVVKRIAEFRIDISNKYFFITSGAVSTEVFYSYEFDKDKLLSLHPIQTFDKISNENSHLLENIYFGIEGGHKASELAIGIIKNLNSNYINIPKDKKYLYHSACVISSNFLITLLNISSEVMGSIGIDKSKTFEIFKPIIDRTLINISEEGLTQALTGPFERNDVETISNHLSSINKELPSLIPFYTLLGMETVKVAFKKESISMKNVISILDLMNEYIINESSISKKTIN
ncbi:MAG: DUF2520 domain-containing protein [Ignavibacteria bacterium]